jgi:hypothetical protein
LFLFLGTICPAQILALGASQTRNFGSLTIAVDVSQTHALVIVTLTLDGQEVGRRSLTTDALVWQFDTQSGTASARGMLCLDVAKAPQFTALYGDFKVSNISEEVPFRGDAFTWLWIDSLIYVEKNFIISSELSARTTVRGFDRLYATVELFAASELLQQFSMTPSAPTSIAQTNLQIGSVIVYQGATFKLTLPTSIQTGQVFMSGSFQSTNTPKTPIAQTIATWPAPSVTETAVKDGRDD